LPPGDFARFGVDDTLRALQALAHASLQRARPRVVAITGSNGKTTTKDLTVAALGCLGSVHGTRGNLNNHIGVPLTVLSRRGDESFLVAEVGTNNFGELDLLSRLLEPDVAAVTNIGRAHLEAFGSQEGVLRAKAEVFTALKPGGIAVLNADDPWTPELARRSGAARVLTFGMASPANYRVESARPIDSGTQQLVLRGVRFVLRRPGRANALDAAAALAIACELGADLPDAAARLEGCEYTAHRSVWVLLGDVEVLDDTYNANPDSMLQALAVLAERPGRRVAVLGDMLELGPNAARMHAEIGERAASTGVESFLGLGPHMRHAVEAAAAAGLGKRAQHFSDLESLVAALRELLRPGDAVLVKGSRGSRMERVVAALGAGVA
jgi:UDP-N-acetylmuramoyl-tripeptide--D-alanyl-D-alanine ligase